MDEDDLQTLRFSINAFLLLLRAFLQQNLFKNGLLVSYLTFFTFE